MVSVRVRVNTRAMDRDRLGLRLWVGLVLV
jgi:hypothetical protein